MAIALDIKWTGRVHLSEQQPEVNAQSAPDQGTAPSV